VWGSIEDLRKLRRYKKSKFIYSGLHNIVMCIEEPVLSQPCTKDVILQHFR